HAERLVLRPAGRRCWISVMGTQAQQRVNAAGSVRVPNLASASLLGPRGASVARASLLALVVLFGARSTDAQPWLLVVVCVAAGCWATASVFAVVYGGRRGTRRLLLAVDTVIVLVSLSATGGAESEISLLLGALPLAVAFQFPAVSVLAACGLAAAAVSSSGHQPRPELVSSLTVLAWAGLSGAAFASDRRRGVRSLEQEMRVRAQLVAAHDYAPARERSRAALEVQSGALQSLRQLRKDVTAGRNALDLAPRCAQVAADVRSLVFELHALSARSIDLVAAVSVLARRRADTSGRKIAATIAPDVPGRADEFVLVLVRDLLDAVLQVSEASTVLAVTVRSDGPTRLSVNVTDSRAQLADNSGRFSRDASGLAPVRRRLNSVAGAHLRVDPGSVEATFPHGSSDSQQTRPVEYARWTLCLPRVLALAAIAMIAAVSKEAHAAFWVLVVVTGCAAVPTTVLLVRSALERADILRLAIFDVALVLCLLALASVNTREHLLPLVVGFPPIFACALPAPLVAKLALGLGAGTAVLAGGPAFAAAYGWSSLLALLLASAVVRGENLMRAMADRSRAALLSLTKAEDDMRKAVARQLHDEALQLLFSARQDLEEAVDPGRRPEALARAAHALGEAEKVLEETSATTLPEQAPEEGLATALTSLGKSVSDASSLAVQTTVDLGDRILAEPALIFGIARELLTNVARHAGADNAYLTLKAEPDGGVTLTVADDGVGLRPERRRFAAAAGHVGLTWVIDRAKDAGGRVRIEEHENPFGALGRSGTAITVTLPGSESPPPTASGSRATRSP
ncbi:MAG: ATP-binding protein, partial [Solirubrobacterales bacterium]|nr:ATP-binding protein [Solirubrobacterales bacterium]